MELETGVLKARGTPSRRIGKGAVAMALATAMLVFGTYLWQHAQVHDRQVALDPSRLERRYRAQPGSGSGQ